MCDPNADLYLIDTYLPQWLVTHTSWEATENEPPSLYQPDPDDEQKRYESEWRFAWTASKSVLLSNLLAETEFYASWYRVGYHVCDHDAEQMGNCQWDDVQEYGAVPRGVPDLQ